MISDSFQTLMLAHLAQVSIVAAVAWLFWRLLAQNRPHFAHAVWALVLVKCLTPPIVSSPTSLFSWYQAEQGQSVEPFESLELARSTLAPKPFTFDDSLVRSNPIPATTADDGQMLPRLQTHLPLLLTCIWAAGTTVGIVFVVIRYVRLVIRIRHLPVVPCAEAEIAMQCLLPKLGINRRVRLDVVDGPIGPAVLGILRPTILIPSVIAQGKTALELEPLIAHELIHVRRGDLAWSWLQSIANCLWWFHPLVWLSSRMIAREAERCCDEEVLGSLGCMPSVYARSLIAVLEKKHQLRAVPALLGVRPIDITSKRIERIMELGQGSQARSPRWVALFATIAALCVLPGAGLVAQNSSPPPTAVPQSDQADQAVVEGAETGSQPHLESYEVEDLLEAMKGEGLNAEQAERALLDLLPLTNQPQSESQTHGDESPSPQPVPVPLKPSNDVVTQENKPTRVLSDGRLIVQATAAEHDVIRKTLEQHRKHGFSQVIIEMVLLSVQHDKAAALISAAKSGKSTPDASDAEVARAANAKSSPHWPHLIELSNVKIPMVAREDIGRWVRDLQDQGIATVFSRPTVITHNGVSASVHVGSTVRVPVPKDGAPESSVSQTIETGFRATILPRIIDDKHVRLELEMRFTKQDPVGVAKIVSFSETFLETAIDSKFDEPILIGGLVHDVQEGDQKSMRELMDVLRSKQVSLIANQIRTQTPSASTPLASEKVNESSTE